MSRFILFDLDDTLIDSAHAAAKGATEWSEEIGVTPDPERWKALEKYWYQKFERGETSYNGQRIGRVRDYMNTPELADEKALALMDSFFPHYVHNVHAFADALPALDAAAASGARVGIFTNGSLALQTQKTTTAGLWRDDLLFFAGADMPAPKPQPESYAFVTQELNCRPQDIVMIGDNVHNDVTGPSQAGWHSIYVDRAGTQAPLADVPGLLTTVSSLADIDFASL